MTERIKRLFYSLKRHAWTAFLALSIFLEMAFMLFFRTREYPRALNELAVFITSLSVGFIILAKYYGREVEHKAGSFLNLKRPVGFASIIGMILGMSIFIGVAYSSFAQTPIDPATSDIIPMIQVAVRRLLSGEKVYQDVTLWGRLPVTYLPMQWLPYTIAELGHFDYRWIATTILFVATAVLLYRGCKSRGTSALLVCLMLLFNGWMILEHERGIISTTVETMIAGYYMFLIMSINSRNPWLPGLMFAVCLLSRYSLILWLPLWAMVVLVQGEYKNFTRSAAVTLCVILCIYVVPFLWTDPDSLGRGYNYYTSAAIGEWKHLNQQGNPIHLYLGLGFSRWFYEYLPQYSIPERIQLLQRVHLMLSVGSVFALGLWYAVKKNAIHPRIFLMASFKIYLVFFLNFIQVPYAYLMITSTFVSIAIFTELSRYCILDKTLPATVA